MNDADPSRWIELSQQGAFQTSDLYHGWASVHCTLALALAQAGFAVEARSKLNKK